MSDVINTKKNINLNEKYHNVVTKHRINNKNDTGSLHNFDWDNIKILHKETNYFKRIDAEIYHIKKEGKNSINVMSDLKDYNASTLLMAKFWISSHKFYFSTN